MGMGAVAAGIDTGEEAATPFPAIGTDVDRSGIEEGVTGSGFVSFPLLLVRPPVKADIRSEKDEAGELADRGGSAGGFLAVGLTILFWEL